MLIEDSYDSRPVMISLFYNTLYATTLKCSYIYYLKY